MSQAELRELIRRAMVEQSRIAIAQPLTTIGIKAESMALAYEAVLDAIDGAPEKLRIAACWPKQTAEKSTIGTTRSRRRDGF